jgi:hypothetical protein
VNAGQWIVRVYNPVTRLAPFYVAAGVTHCQLPCAKRFATFSQALNVAAPIPGASVERVRNASH